MTSGDLASTVDINSSEYRSSPTEAPALESIAYDTVVGPVLQYNFALLTGRS